MSGRKTSIEALSQKCIASRSARLNDSASPSTAPAELPEDPLLLLKYQALFRAHLSTLLDGVFSDFTGLHFHVAWAPTPSSEWERRTLPTACSVCCRLSGSPRLAVCRTCGPRQLACALKAAGNGYVFTCRLGVHNFWLPVRLRGQTIGLAYLQALEHFRRPPPAGRRSRRATPPRPGGKDARGMNRLEFARAARFLRLIVQLLQASSLADLQNEDLTKVRQALHVFENVQLHLRQKLNGLMPAIREASPVPQPQSRPERIVQAALDRIHQDYTRPLTLRRCANDLRVNATYLSHLFSHAVGLTFKTCLTEVRMEKARELLGDPARNISQIAGAVGYASANRFRLAFKNVTGVSPRVWRETLRMSLPESAP